MTRVLVFDLDDTLFPEWQYVQSGFTAVGEWLKAEKGVDGFEPAAMDLFRSGLRGTIFNRALERCRYPYSQGLIQELVRIYREHRPTLSLYRDAQWALERFSALRLGLVSDGYLVAQTNKLAALGICDRFDIIVLTDQYGRDCWKPSPFAFEKIMSEAHASPEECLYVGDNPAKDFFPGRQLGWRTVQVCRPDSEYGTVQAATGYEADVRIESLYGLESIVA